MQEPLVSVIVPVYNTEKYVERCILSILDQKYMNIELLLINDGSTDDSETICKKYATSDYRVKYIYQNNMGQSEARNRGIAEARGEYVLFCDSDDVWKPNLLELVMEVFGKEKCDLVRFGSESKNEEVYPSEKPDSGCFTQREIAVQYFNDGKLCRNLSSAVWGAYKREIIIKNDLRFSPLLKRGEDSVFVMKYLLCCDKICFIPEYLYVYYPIFEDRVNSTARNIKELYNEYELVALMFQELYYKWKDLFSEEEKMMAYGSFYDRVIGRLVRFAAYSTKQTRTKDKKNLKQFLNQIYVIDAGNYYQRKRRADSRVIPFLMKRRWTSILWIVLRSKRDKYYQMYGKKKYAESIWKKDELIKSV